MNNKFWKFEKDELALYMADRPDYEISDFLDDEEIKIIEKTSKYGSLEYLSDNLIFKPSKEDTKSIEIDIFLGEDDPRKILETILSLIRTPFSINIDFWCLGESTNQKDLLLIFPSLGTVVNSKKYMKFDYHVDELVDSFDHSKNDLCEKVFNAHATARPTVRNTGVRIFKLLTMRMWLSKRLI